MIFFIVTNYYFDVFSLLILCFINTINSLNTYLKNTIRVSFPQLIRKIKNCIIYAFDVYLLLKFVLFFLIRSLSTILKFPL